MSEVTHFVRNGDNITGILWNNENLGKVFVLMNNVDMNFDLEISEATTGKIVKYVDLRDFLLEVLPIQD
jgi:hypothetical protein